MTRGKREGRAGRRRRPACSPHRHGLSRRLSVELLEDRRMLAVAFDLLKDVNLVNAESSNPEQLVAVGDQVFFVAERPETGAELWKSDGTAAGTRLVKDILPGALGSDPSNLVNVGGTLFFVASDGVHGRELWKSNGTEAGTVQVKDINPGSADSATVGLTNVGGLLYFPANDGIHGWELWKSDGSEAGTTIVKDVRPGSGSAYVGYITQVGTEIFFAANETGSSDGSRLWKTDGTPEGTVRVDANIQATAVPYLGADVNGTLYYTTTYGLAKSDGTPEGTTLVKEFDVRPTNLTAVGDTLFFVGDEPATGAELWTSDGTEAGTTLVIDIDFGADDSGIGCLTNIGGTLYFLASDYYSSASGYLRQLWRSDGSEEGTVWAAGVNISGDFPPVGVGGVIYFVPQTGELWRTDGTPDTDGEVAEINTEPGEGSWPGSLTDLNGTLLFSADDGLHGRELWRSDGTAEGTWLVADLNVVTTGDSSPYDLTAYNGELYFLAYNGVNREFWESDGTPAGTDRVKDLFQGDVNGHTLSLTRFGDRLLLTASEGPSGENLWASDGTEEGTAILKVLRESDPHSIAFQYPMPFAEAGGLIYFRGLKPDGEVSSLWRSDGTEAGTFTLNDPDGGGTRLSPVCLTALGDLMMFRADDGVSGYELWRTDGTNEGTYRVKDINPGSASSASVPASGYPPPPPMTAVGGVLYFFADDGTSGVEPWRSDGTEQGTYRLKDVRPGPDSSTSIGDARPFALDGTLYFTVSHGVTGYELWKSDGTEEDTVLVRSIHAGIGVSIGGTRYLSADDGVAGYELWKLEAGASGPELVADINPGGSSTPNGLTNINGTLYFTADDGIHGRELWRSDGTAAGTELVHDFTGDENGSSPLKICKYDGRLVVSALTEQYGRELWIADFAATGDFTMDGKVDQGDYDAWRAAFGSTADLAADGNRNGVVDAADYTVWRDNYFPPPMPALPGDYNGDGYVDAADYTVWRDTLGESVANPYDGADGDGDREITEGDYVVWKSHFGETSPPPASGSATEGLASSTEIVMNGLPAGPAAETPAAAQTASQGSAFAPAAASASRSANIVDHALMELARYTAGLRRHTRAAPVTRGTSGITTANDTLLLFLATSGEHARGRTDAGDPETLDALSEVQQDNDRDDVFAAIGVATNRADAVESFALSLIDGIGRQ